MLISRSLLLALHTTSKDGARPILEQIDIKREGNEIVAVATDSYVLSEIREEVPKDDEYPGSNDANYPPVDHIRVGRKTAEKIRAALRGKASKSLPILGYAQATKSGITTTDLKVTTEFTEHQVEGDFPNYQRVIPNDREIVRTIKVNPELLMKALSIFEKGETVTIQISENKLDAVALRAESPGKKKLALVMPLRK